MLFLTFMLKRLANRSKESQKTCNAEQPRDWPPPALQAVGALASDALDLSSGEPTSN